MDARQAGIQSEAESVRDRWPSEAELARCMACLGRIFARISATPHPGRLVQPPELRLGNRGGRSVRDRRTHRSLLAPAPKPLLGEYLYINGPGPSQAVH